MFVPRYNTLQSSVRFIIRIGINSANAFAIIPFPQLRNLFLPNITPLSWAYELSPFVLSAFVSSYASIGASDGLFFQMSHFTTPLGSYFLCIVPLCFTDLSQYLVRPLSPIQFCCYDMVLGFVSEVDRLFISSTVCFSSLSSVQGLVI